MLETHNLINKIILYKCVEHLNKAPFYLKILKRVKLKIGTDNKDNKQMEGQWMVRRGGG